MCTGLYVYTMYIYTGLYVYIYMCTGLYVYIYVQVYTYIYMTEYIYMELYFVLFLKKLFTLSLEFCWKIPNFSLFDAKILNSKPHVLFYTFENRPWTLGLTIIHDDVHKYFLLLTIVCISFTFKNIMTVDYQKLILTCLSV